VTKYPATVVPRNCPIRPPTCNAGDNGREIGWHDLRVPRDPWTGIITIAAGRPGEITFDRISSIGSTRFYRNSRPTAVLDAITYRRRVFPSFFPSVSFFSVRRPRVRSPIYYIRTTDTIKPSKSSERARAIYRVISCDRRPCPPGF